MVPTPMCRLLPGATLGLLWLALAAPVHAQTAATARPDPADPTAPVPAVRHVSAFAQFRRLGDDQPVPWRDANDTVARIGGWRVYTREAQQPDPPAAATPVPAASPTPVARPAPAGPAGHKH